MKNNTLITAVIFMLLGLVLLIVPGEIITTIIRIFGIIITVSGALSIWASVKNNTSNFEIAYGILISILGLVFITNPSVIASIIPLVLGIWLIIKSAFKLQYVFFLKKEGFGYWNKSLIINILTLILGLVLAFNPFKGAEALVRIIAIFMIASSILDLIDCFLTRPKKIKIIK